MSVHSSSSSALKDQANEEQPLLSPGITIPSITVSSISFVAFSVPTLFVVFVYALGSDVQILPYYQELEKIICKATIDQVVDCKSQEVQVKLLNFRATQRYIGIPVSIILAMLYGYFTKTWERRYSLRLALAGVGLSQMWIAFVCYFKLDIRWTFIQSAFYLIGGGPIVVDTILHLLVLGMPHSDTKKSTFQQRSTLLLIIIAVLKTGSMLGGQLSSRLIKNDVALWIPWTVGAILVCISFLMTFLRSSIPAMTNNTLKRSVGGPEDLSNKDHVSGRPAFLLLLMSLLGNLGADSLSTELLFTYMSTKYHEGFPSIEIYSGVGKGGQTLLFGLFLPLLVSYLLRSNRTARQTGCQVALASSLVLFIGTMVLGLAPTFYLAIAGHAITLLGTGFMSLVSCLIAVSFPDEQVVSTYFKMEYLGSIIAAISAKAYPWLFEIGSKHAVYGLPYLGAAVLYFFAFITTFWFMGHGTETSEAL